MYLYSSNLSSILIGFSALFIFILMLWVISIQTKNKQTIKIRDAYLSFDDLEKYARETAFEHITSNKRNMSGWPIPRVNENYSYIASVYKELNEDIRKKRVIPPASEWLLDNFYIIEEQVKGIRRDLTKKIYLRLPILERGPLNGYARIYAVAMDLVAHAKGQIDDTVILNYVKAYQSHNTLSDRELWAFSPMIRIAMIENIKSVCEKIRDTRFQWHKADEIVDNFLNEADQDTEKLIRGIENRIKYPHEIYPSFIEHLSYRLRRAGRNFSHVFSFLEEKVSQYGFSMDGIMQKEHDAQAFYTLLMGNCILSIKAASSMDWTEIFALSSRVEQTLSQDPSGIYSRMDLSSRDYYRKRLEELASIYKLSELHIARECIELAKNADGHMESVSVSGPNLDMSSDRLQHVGYYIVGKGIRDLEKRLGYKPNLFYKANFFRHHPAAAYLGSVLFITIALMGFMARYSFYVSTGYHFLWSVLASIAVLLPSFEIAVSFVNWIVCKVTKPYSFPKLELKEGLDKNLTSVVIIPALLPDEKRVDELLSNLETHYLANKEDNLYFMLVGDFKDASERNMPGDERVIDTALKGIKELNEKYSSSGKDIFYYFHRCRQYNKNDHKWMGWERKRGALIEFNEMMLGSKETSFFALSNQVTGILPVKYVVTLDADTMMPIGAVKKMIGIMAHPLNRPVIDKERGIVVEGYGLIQPKIVFDIESSNRSLFSRIFTGQEGLDPYASAISDVYQDLFGEGIFTGKGIYDLAVFQSILKNAIPDHTVLSHDLLEGSYIRAGLATELELVDSYPSRYNSYAARLHRWVRGDWQLLPWLGSTVRNRTGKPVKNGLSFISKWKIFDNMRRSLTLPSFLRLIILAFGIFPGNPLIWLGYSLFALAFPVITATIDNLLSWRLGKYRIKQHTPMISGIKSVFFQVLFLFALLPYQAYLMMDAVVKTLIRVLFTKKNLLEWVTAADVEKGQKNSLKSYWNKMRIPAFIGVLPVIFAFLMAPNTLLLALSVFTIWILSPYIAYKMSLPEEEIPVALSESDVNELRRISRKTWRFFEEFINSKGHFLPPDNYQEDPPNGVAYRTSPTNIGLGLLTALTARDFGFTGTREMTEMIFNTVSTIEKLEKWNGHLYNWYNTRTLHPLKPRYVSTVDNGNFICYLITLIQGLNEYLESPLVDKKLPKGLKDTLILIKKDNPKLYSGIDLLDEFSNKEQMDLRLWSQALDELRSNMEDWNTKKSPWIAKSRYIIHTFKTELSEFMSWVETVNRMPKELSDDIAAVEIIKSIEPHTPLKQLPNMYDSVLRSLHSYMNTIQDGKNNPHEIVSWWLELEASIKKAFENVTDFIARYHELILKIEDIIEHTEFKPLYVEKKQLFSIGFNIEENRLTNSYYDLLASEARQTSFLAIARGEVPYRHWFKMGRSLTTVDNYKGLVSWTGTMFEYLMPLLIMKNYKNTMLDETYSFVLRSQKKYAKQRRVPWGSSESGFYALDTNLDYQYKAIGVPWLGLKRGLIEDLVVTSYATFLALPLDPSGAMDNIKRLKSEGMDGAYGYYEAVDYTPERIPFGLKRAIVKSFMAHHQGMSLLSLSNYLNDNIMQKRFHSSPVVKAAELLLQEKIPANVIFTKETKEKAVPFKAVVYKEKGLLRKFKQPDPVLPKVHILSNGDYSVMVTDRGTGYSKNKMVSVTRWREDSTLNNYGMFFFIRDVDSGQIWTSTYNPYARIPERYEVTFTSDKARFKRKDGDIESETEITVTSGDNAEIRRITLKNKGEDTHILEITSYFEVVLAPQGADLAHPAFSNLFVKTEFLPEYNSLIANRRPRSESDKSLWIANMAVIEGETVGSLEYETDRMQFIGRDRTLSHPIAMDSNKPLSNSTGPVLDPIMSLRTRITVEPSQAVKISFVASVSESRDASIVLLERYSKPEAIEGAFKLALTRSQVEAEYLNMKASEIEVYQDMMSHILFMSPLRRRKQDVILQNKRGQSALWAFGISGDLPILLVTLQKQDEIDLLYEVFKAHEYWRVKELKVDLVILNEEESSYTHPLRRILADMASSSHAHDIVGNPGGIYILNRNHLSEEDIILLYSVARLVLKGNVGTLSEQLQVVIPHYPLPSMKNFTAQPGKYYEPMLKALDLKYFNGIGGFSHDGCQYIMRLERGVNTPLPWINVIANPHFGFIVSESGSGYTWSGNSRENKLTPWSNDPVSDPPGETFYVSDNDTGELWSIAPLPIRQDIPYTVTHGFGYTQFEHISQGIEQIMVQFVPVEESVKISIIKLRNLSGESRNLSLTYYIRPVLGVTDQSTAMHISTSVDDKGSLLVQNPYNEEFPGRIAFIDVSEKECTVTGDRKEFFGKGSLSSPESLRRQNLSGTVGPGYDPCAAMQINIFLNAYEEKEVVFLLGEEQSAQRVAKITDKYKNVNEAKKALQQVKGFWEEKLGAIKIDTPELSMNFMLNGWLIYQIISCRLWARSAFYQSGGAYGFRDQLQDSLSVVYSSPEIVRSQILLHAKHQFAEGDVQHWWHEPKGKGTRTRFSDDLLWLPYVTSEYIKVSGDSQILEKEIPFIEDEPLKEFEDERYSRPAISAVESSLYDHCVRAIEKSLQFGEHELPLMGSGDWNDGMNTVGNRGRGESVWLGWFLYSTLMKFIPICHTVGDTERAKKYTDIAQKILYAIEKNAWDGNWYLRAYFDNGLPLGSLLNDECKIDSISQTWAVISGGGSTERIEKAMNSLENYLIERDAGLIKLLTPPFDDSDLEPGYIKGYVPGVRENGGQYTHAAAWVIIAFAKLGQGDKAWDLFELINPINHTRTHIEYAKYKAEPYVMPADIYAVEPHIGRGGWTWYTGSASWMYKAGLEYILGLRKMGDKLTVDPCIPKKWKEYSIKYKYLDTQYDIKIKNPESVNSGVKSIVLDGVAVIGSMISLVDDKVLHHVEVVLGKAEEAGIEEGNINVNHPVSGKNHHPAHSLLKQKGK